MVLVLHPEVKKIPLASRRQKIEFYARLKLGPRDIGRRLGRHHSVISREPKLGYLKDLGYRAETAQKRAKLRSHKTNKSKLEKDDLLRWYVENKLSSVEWSPEQIAIRLKNIRHPP